MLEAWKAAGRPVPPIAAHMGFDLVELGDGSARFELGVDLEKHGNPMGTVQGGVLVALADAAMGIAYASLLAVDETFTTLELKINYLKPVWSGRLFADGSVLKSGRTVGLTECRITDETGSLVAYATSTCMTLRGESAQGR